MSQFQNANAYERYMSGWSRAAGTQFLDWLALPPGLRWLDVGCGSGAFTALLAERAAPDESTALPQLQALWQAAGLQAVTTAAFTVHQRYPDFAAYWQALQDSASIGARLAALSDAARHDVRDALRSRLPTAADGSITINARAHAVRGINR